MTTDDEWLSTLIADEVSLPKLSLRLLSYSNVSVHARSSVEAMIKLSTEEMLTSGNCMIGSLINFSVRSFDKRLNYSSRKQVLP